MSGPIRGISFDVDGKTYFCAEEDLRWFVATNRCKLQHTYISSFAAGDVYETSNIGFPERLLITSNYVPAGNPRFSFNILTIKPAPHKSAQNQPAYILHWFSTKALSEAEVLDFLNTRRYKFVENINDKIASLIVEAKKESTTQAPSNGTNP